MKSGLAVWHPELTELAHRGVGTSINPPGGHEINIPVDRLKTENEETWTRENRRSSSIRETTKRKKKEVHIVIQRKRKISSEEGTQ